jgi:ubiquinone/menaquinone biosynthesis C-methylase UbiE
MGLFDVQLELLRKDSVFKSRSCGLKARSTESRTPHSESRTREFGGPYGGKIHFMSNGHHQAVQQQFTRTAEAFAKFATRDTPEMLAERIELAGLRSDDLLLDVACGPGAFVLAAAPQVRFARGVDLTAEMLRHARAFQAERGIANAAFDLGEAERLPYADGSFDLVSCQFAFHHMPRPETTLVEMGRVMKSHGRIFLVDSVGPEDPAASELHNEIERLRDPSHVTTLSLWQFLEMFAAQGLSVHKQRGLDRPRSFNQWMLRAGHDRSDAAYQKVRRMMESSIPGDRAAFGVTIDGDDLRIVHREGLFLLGRKAAEN